MSYPPDQRLVDINKKVCRSPPLSPDNTLVEVFEIVMQQPTLPNLNETEKIMLALTHPLLQQFTGETCQTRIALCCVIKAKLAVLLQHVPPNDRFVPLEHSRKVVFVRLINVRTSLEGHITKLLNSQVTTFLTMCQDIIVRIKARINEQTWELRFWKFAPGRYDPEHVQWGSWNSDADIQTALALSAAEALRAPAAAVAPAARTDDDFGSDNGDADPNIQAAIIASLAPAAVSSAAAPAAVSSAAAPAAVSSAAVSSDAPCVVCNETHDLFAIVPCGHVCVCKKCADKLSGKRCPLCRGSIEHFMQLFR
jgi:hypothetical protein